MKLRRKISLSISGIILLILIIFISIVITNVRSSLSKTMDDLAKETAFHYAKQVQSYLDIPMDEARAIGTLFSSIIQHRETLDFSREDANTLLRDFIESRPDYLGTYVMFKADQFDGLDKEYAGMPLHDESGRFIPYWTLDSNGRGVAEPLMDYDSPDAGWAQDPINKKIECIQDPFLYPIQGVDTLMTSMTLPLFAEDGQVAGIFGFDIGLNQIQAMVGNTAIANFENAYVTIYSHNGTVVASRKKEYVGKAIEETTGVEEYIEKVRKGEEFNMIRYSQTLDSYIISYGVPISIGESDTPWIATVNLSVAEMYKDLNRLVIQIILFALISMLVIITITFFLSRMIAGPVNTVALSIQNISEGDGDLTKRIDVNGNDEIAELSVHFNRFVENLAHIISAIRNVVYENAEIRENLSANTNETSAAVEEISANLKRFGNNISVLESRMNESTDSTNKIGGSISELTRQIEEQSMMVTESSSAVDQMFASINNVGAITRAKREVSAKLSENARKGGEVLQQTTSAVTEINNELDEIMNLSNIIAGIASQTNLLSMNAAIEAAHAGDSGKGFAVVADEIRKLAETSSSNSKNISHVISSVGEKIRNAAESSLETSVMFNEIEASIRDVVSALDEIIASTQELQSGGEVILKAMNSLREISEKVTGNTSSINSGSNEVSSAVDSSMQITREVSQGIQEILIGTDEITRAISALVDITAQLGESSQSLENEVNRFRVDDDKAGKI